MNCMQCEKYSREKDKCEIYGEIIAVLCCKDFAPKKTEMKKDTPTAVGGRPSMANMLNKKKVEQNEKQIQKRKNEQLKTKTETKKANRRPFEKVCQTNYAQNNNFTK